MELIFLVAAQTPSEPIAYILTASLAGISSFVITHFGQLYLNLPKQARQENLVSDSRIAALEPKEQAFLMRLHEYDPKEAERILNDSKLLQETAQQTEVLQPKLEFAITKVEAQSVETRRTLITGGLLLVCSICLLLCGEQINRIEVVIWVVSVLSFGLIGASSWFSRPRTIWQAAESF